jgi:hypothetical protein
VDQEDTDNYIDIVRAAVEELCDNLEEKVPVEAIDIAVFECFTQRLLDRNMEPLWRTMLESALEDQEWPTQSIH